METAKYFENGGVKRAGESVTLTLKDEDETWNTFLNGLHSFTDDFMEDGRAADILSVREPL